MGALSVREGYTMISQLPQSVRIEDATTVNPTCLEGWVGKLWRAITLARYRRAIPGKPAKYFMLTEYDIKPGERGIPPWI
jgi:hypothetical protein